jgi:hypothetical protein
MTKTSSETSNPKDDLKPDHKIYPSDEYMYNLLKSLFRVIREQSKSLYYFCFLDKANFPTFCKLVRTNAYQRKQDTTDRLNISFDKWEYAHRDVLVKTYEFIQDYVSPGDFAAFVYDHSSACDCYKIKKDWEYWLKD